ncbi:hypothetical protein HPSH417_06270 [Helicobacter pylori Shi417]|nr:hypothetical protein HPSH417_06270 [Helicobacter pylori Shi417]
MKALLGSKWHELADIRAEMCEEKEKQLGIKEESIAEERKSFEREKKLVKKEIQVEREILEICYNNGYLPQNNKPRIEHDDTIDIDPEDEKD